MIDDRSRVPTRLSILRWPVALGALALTLLTLAGPSSSADPVTITMARNADMLTFDPAATEDDPSIFVELQIFDRLVKLNAANNGVEPELATSWTVAPDGLSAMPRPSSPIASWAAPGPLYRATHRVLPSRL